MFTIAEERTPMRISIVTPNYNMAAYLPTTIHSVFANLAPGDEYFIMDGGSSDDSAAVIQAHADRLTGWVSERDAGYADAIAKGFKLATGDILCWINSGDLLLAGALDRVRAIFDECDAELIFGDDFYIDDNCRIVRFSRGYVPDLSKAMLHGGWTPLQDACFWRRTLYERVGGLDKNQKYAADYDLFLRMSLVGKSRYVPYVFSAFRRHEGQKSVAGMKRYRIEKRECQRRILAASLRQDRRVGSLARLLQRCRSFSTTNRMRLRARLAPLLWARTDLVGQPIDTLSCGRYWPPGSEA